MTLLMPGSTIGILGGGQLGRMLALAAARLGMRCHIYAPETAPPASFVSAKHTRAKYEDTAALAGFARACDVVTYEFENIPYEAAKRIAKLRPLHPSAEALRIAQDRILEKTYLRERRIPTTRFAEINTPDDIVPALAETGLPAVLKTRRSGYDGKGQVAVRTAEATRRAVLKFKGTPLILEARVNFVKEISVICACSGKDIRMFDPVENTHKNHILQRSRVPARIAPKTAVRARALGKQIARALAYRGVLAVEMFVLRDGALLVNEIAPRVHNSGHWTLDACSISQFEQHIRAICGLPLGTTARHSDAVMHNIIGGEVKRWRTHAGARDTALHLYAKAEPRAGRKMGHITRLCTLGSLT